MMIGPAPMMRMVEISVRLGMGSLRPGDPSLASMEPLLHETTPLRDPNRRKAGFLQRSLGDHAAGLLGSNLGGLPSRNFRGAEGRRLPTLVVSFDRLSPYSRFAD